MLRTWLICASEESSAVYPVSTGSSGEKPSSLVPRLTATAVGITSSQVLVYLAELAPAKTRGQIVGIQQWAIDWGILISEFLTLLMTFPTRQRTNG